MKSRIKNNRILFLCFILPILFSALLFLVLGVFPFGSKSNLYFDLDIQYTDYFAWYRNVLLGKADFAYSFSKSVGGQMVAIWGYYLSSPLNLLLVLFKQEQFQIFVFAVTSIKLGLSGLTFGIFIKAKYKKLSELYILLFSLSYAFTQFAVGQMTNIMWLDGLYMLPLILLATDRFIKDGKSVFFSITVCLSIVFNWYTAYMNCIFAVIYYLYSFFLASKGFEIKSAVKSLVKFLFAELLGVLASMAVFLPVLLAQSGGRGFDEGIFDFATNGSFLDILRGVMIGAPVGNGEITLFCTVFSLSALFLYFLNKSIPVKEKAVSGLFVLFMAASMFFTPLEHIWVGFKYEYSYNFRFLYLVLAAIITVAANGMSESPLPSKRSLKIYAVSSVLTLLILDMLSSFIALRLWAEIAIIFAYFLLFFICACDVNKKTVKSVCTVGITAVFMGELLINAYLLLRDSVIFDSESYIKYAENQSKLVSQIQNDDESVYRIEQTLNRDAKKYESFYCCEALTYNYFGIQHYSSSYDGIAADCLRSLGYCRNSFPTFYHEPILAADSLLGVKYLLSDTECSGYSECDGFDAYNGKTVYENNFALPLAFSCDDGITEVGHYGKDPFEYQTEIYSAITGKGISLYSEYTGAKKTKTEDGIVYKIPKLSSSGIIYARISDSNADKSCNISIDGAAVRPCADGWLSHNVFCIGSTEKAHTLFADRDVNVDFRVLDTAALKAATDGIKEGSARQLKLDGKTVSFTATGERVMLTVPYDVAWDITVNGKAVEAEKGADAFIVIPLDGTGVSEVAMVYRIRGLGLGIILSAAALAAIVMTELFRRKMQKRQ